MRFKVFKNTVLFQIIIGMVLTISCGKKIKLEYDKTTTEYIGQKDTSITPIVSKYEKDQNIIVGANQTKRYLQLLKGKRVGIIANQTSVIFKKHKTKDKKSKPHTHLVDSLIALDVDIKKVFAPEHGFRGIADAGELIKDGIDTKTGLPIISLYGKNKKPSPEQLEDIDMIIFDIQDVGARFYTYISSLHYVMEACAEKDIPVLILDRPNPNGHYIDGPILEVEYQSFVGMHPVPVVHGMTIGEYAQMINGERWLKNHATCELTIIPVKNYTHKTEYSLPIKPSPNLPNDVAVNLYPSLCFFEGTNVSIGRGTDIQFQIVGSPFFKIEDYTLEFTPQPNEGAKYPKHQDKLCYGYDLSKHEKLNKINLNWLVAFYQSNKTIGDNTIFFNPFFTKLAGTRTLQSQIEAGLSATEIQKSWMTDLVQYKTMRQKYLIYD